MDEPKLTISPPPLTPTLLPVQSNQGDYTAKTQNDEMRTEIKPRYCQSRVSDDKTRERTRAQEQLKYKVHDDDDSDGGPMTKQITDLTKVRMSGQNKYGGEDLYDFLDQKVAVFHEFCEKWITTITISLGVLDHAERSRCRLLL